jgi:hypothetical protein
MNSVANSSAVSGNASRRATAGTGLLRKQLGNHPVIPVQESIPQEVFCAAARGLFPGVHAARALQC